jgi:transposase
MTIKIIREDLTAAELRREAARSSDATAARRVLAIALILDGRSRADAARECGMDRQTLRDWVHRYNADGLAGVCDRPHAGGPRPRLSAEQQEQVAA